MPLSTNSSLLKAAGVAILFAITGAGSNFIGGGETFRSYLIGIPFALVAALLLPYTPRHKAVMGVSVSLVWIVAFYTALEMDPLHRPYLQMSCAGFVGGAGVTLAAQVGRWMHIGWRTVLIGALAGSLAALPFCWNFSATDNLVVQFAIWQAVVGTFLYLVANKELSASRI